MEERKDEFDGEVQLHSPVLKWLDNFWYHYKWHTVVAIFLVIAVTVTSLQMCKKTSYDAYILYAGNHEISRTSTDGDVPYNTMVSSLKRACEDFDNDGSVNISLLNLFVLNADEIEDALAGTTGKEINQALVTEDTETLKNTLLFGEYYLCFLSERLFLEYDAAYDGALFASLVDYVPEDSNCQLISERGVYLASLPFYTLPEVSNLPDDTVICLRKISDVSNVFGKDENEKNFHRAKAILQNILEYK